MPTPNSCTARQVSDQMRCEVCDLTWDTNDTDPPPCGAYVVPQRTAVVGGPQARARALRDIAKLFK